MRLGVTATYVRTASFCPQATIWATSPGSVWALDRDTFTRVMILGGRQVLQQLLPVFPRRHMHVRTRVHCAFEISFFMFRGRRVRLRVRGCVRDCRARVSG